MLIVGRFSSFLACCMSFQIVSGRLLLYVGRIRSYKLESVRYRSPPVVSCSLGGRFRSLFAHCRSFQVASGRFLLGAGSFRSFLARCRSF